MDATLIDSGRGSAWLERLVRDQEVGGSNPLAPTIYPLCFHGVQAAVAFWLAAAFSSPCPELSLPRALRARSIAARTVSACG